jgi:AraC-like DNA-binding protein
MSHAYSSRKPCPQLEEVVWSYSHKHVLLDGAFTHRVTAKAAPVLEFIFGDRPLIRHVFNGMTTRSPVSLLIGPQTKPGTELELSGSFESFGIVFHPAGLHRLIGFPVDDITDKDAEGASVLGPVANKMREMLGNCKTFDERVRLSNHLLLDIYLNRIRKKGISPVVRRILHAGGNEKIDTMFRGTGLSKRTFERHFREQAGMSAKLFSRIVRFQAALDRKVRAPMNSWTLIAQECGYFDQMHLIHDFEEFTAECPGEVLRSAERIYGQHSPAAGNRNKSDMPDSILL